MKQPDPLAVVLYFPQTTATGVSIDADAGSPLIKGIDAQQRNGSQTTRVEIQLGVDAAYTAEQEGRITSYNVCYTKLLRIL